MKIKFLVMGLMLALVNKVSLPVNSHLLISVSEINPDVYNFKGLVTPVQKVKGGSQLIGEALVAWCNVAKKFSYDFMSKRYREAYSATLKGKDFLRWFVPSYKKELLCGAAVFAGSMALYGSYSYGKKVGKQKSFIDNRS